jgi:photosystem II stability/assembly factor-like uncharacterized protein
MKLNKSLTLGVVLAAILVLPGCIKIKTTESGPGVSYGGVYKSIDAAATWAPVVDIATTTAEKPSIHGLTINSFAIDPQDNEAFYVGTEGAGLFYSYDGARSWKQAPELAEGTVNAIAVHPKNKCTIFAARRNEILKSDDCSRTWQRVFFDSRLDLDVTALAMDWFDPRVLFAGTTYGEILRSTDGGKSWATVQRTEDRIQEIIIAADTRNVYVATEYQGLYVTTDKGNSWTHRYEEIRKTGVTDELRDITLDYRNNVLIISTKHGLMRSADMGKSWTSIPLIEPADSGRIFSVVTNPTNSNEIYYGTATAFFRTQDGGKNWVAEQLPTPSITNILAIHPREHATLYAGFKKIEQE